MTLRKALWLTPALLYALFVLWYTELGGPLTAAEIDGFVAQMTEQGGEPETIARLAQFFREDTGRQFLMLNAIDMAEHPSEVDGAPSDADADMLMGLYMEHMIVELLRRGCHPVVLGTAVSPALDLVGIDEAEHWTDGALFRYRSRRDLMAIAVHPEMGKRHAFKLAALDKTIAYPIETTFYLGDLRLLLGLLSLCFAAVMDATLPNANTGSAAGRYGLRGWCPSESSPLS